MFQKLLKLAPLCAALALVSSMPAHADYVFSGSGSSGNLTPGAEGWAFNFTGSDNWGSPGVGAGVTPYSRALAAYGFDIDFTGGGTILPGSIALGNASGCAGTTGGGTTFCTTPFTSADIWIAFQTDADSIAFRSQNASFNILPGESYFVNVFFEGGTPTGFTGRWLTEFSPNPNPVPEPGSLAMAGLALAALVMTRRKAG